MSDYSTHKRCISSCLIFSLDPLPAYHGKTITLELPGDLTIFDIAWFSIFDLETNENLGSIVIPDGLNVPPSLVKVIVSIGQCRTGLPTFPFRNKGHCKDISRRPIVIV